MIIMTPEYFIIPFIMTQVNNILKNLNTGIYLLDCLLLLFLVITIFVIDFKSIKGHVRNYIDNLYNIKQLVPTIILSKTNNLQSTKFKSIMYFASNLANSSIYSLEEYFITGWDRNDNKTEKESGYIVNQKNEFKLDDDIYGILNNTTEESITVNENDDSNKVTNKILVFKIFTKKKSISQLIKWIDDRVTEYEKYLCEQTIKYQLLLNISSDHRNELVIKSSKWESTITDANTYFPELDNIIKKIDFFLHNKQWYIDHGIPYNMGILLYGHPGCGKTRFIKLLMNYTGRHGIDIKLNDTINFTDLKQIIYKDKIGEKYIIPQEKRIIIFEDIDCMGSMVAERDKLNIDDNMIDDTISENENDIKHKSTSSKKKDLKNNNLSYLLNILDGLNECCGRIIIMTTNKINSLDKALIRPGRIDIKIEFKKCTRYDIYKMIKIFWKEGAQDVTEANIKNELENKYTSAEIINIFRSTDNFNDIINIFI